MLNSTQVKVLVEVEVELGKMYIVYFDCPYVSILPKWGLTEICKEKLFAPFSGSENFSPLRCPWMRKDTHCKSSRWGIENQFTASLWRTTYEQVSNIFQLWPKLNTKLRINTTTTFKTHHHHHKLFYMKERSYGSQIWYVRFTNKDKMIWEVWDPPLTISTSV